MKNIKYVIYAISYFSLLFSVNASAYSIRPTMQTVNTNQSIKNTDIQQPFHCNMQPQSPTQIITNIVVGKEDFKLVPVFKNNNLPRYEVNGFSFESMPLDESIQQLVESADIEVYTEDSHYVELDATDIFGELSQVIEELTTVGNTYYSYDDKKKILYIKKNADFVMQVPQNRLLILSVLDTLKSAGIKNAVPNWNSGVISMSLTRAEEKRVNKLMAQLINNESIIVADTQIHGISSAIEPNWMNILKTVGLSKIHTLSDGLMGKILSYSAQTNPQLLSTLSQSYPTSVISNGVALIPNTWKTKFDIGKCTTNAFVNPLSLIIKPTMDKDIVNLKVTLAAKRTEISTYDINTHIGDTVAIIGLQAPNIVNASEFLVTLNLKLIRLIKEG